MSLHQFNGSFHPWIPVARHPRALSLTHYISHVERRMILPPPALSIRTLRTPQPIAIPITHIHPRIAIPTRIPSRRVKVRLIWIPNTVLFAIPFGF